jgi:intein/homing endonuclease
MPPTIDNTSELKKLLEEDIAIGKDNNRLLREMRRNAILGLIAKIIIWLVLLGVPLFFLSTYLGPILDAFTGQSASGQAIPGGLFGIPSEEQINKLIEQYQAVQE